MRSGAKYLWFSLIFTGLVLVPIYVMAISLVIRTSLLKFNGGSLDGEQVKAVWAFIGAAFAAGVSLLGLLLGYIHNSRTHQLARESELRIRLESERTHQLSEESEGRLRLESVVKGLELLTDGQKYAPKARVAGSLATLVRLGQPSIALATLRTAWEAGAVDAVVAAWLINRIIETGSPSEVSTASMYLMERASELVTEFEGGLLVVVPDSIEDAWNTEWPRMTKIQFVGTLALAHVAVKREAWRNGRPVLLQSLWRAAQDPDGYVATTAAKLLGAIAPTVDELQPLFGPGPAGAGQGRRCLRSDLDAVQSAGVFSSN